MTGTLARAAAAIAMTMAAVLAPEAMAESRDAIAEQPSAGFLDENSSAFGPSGPTASFSLTGVSTAGPVASFRTMPAGTSSPDARFTLTTPEDRGKPGTVTTGLMIMAVPGPIAGVGASVLLAAGGLFGILHRRRNRPA